MKSRVGPMCVWAGLFASSMSGQLYLVTGTQTPRNMASFSSALWRLGQDGRFQPSGEIAPRESGLFWVEVDYEARLLVALTCGSSTGEVGSAIIVVDFDKGDIVKRCPAASSPPNFISIEEWLANIPGKGVAFVDRLEATAAVNGKQEFIRAMRVDPSIPCKPSYQMIAPSDSTDVIVNGRAGVAGIAANDMVVFAMDTDGRIFRRFRDGQMVYVGYQVPESLRLGVERPGFAVMINNLRFWWLPSTDLESTKFYGFWHFGRAI